MFYWNKLSGIGMEKMFSTKSSSLIKSFYCVKKINKTLHVKISNKLNFN